MKLRGLSDSAISRIARTFSGKKTSRRVRGQEEPPNFAWWPVEKLEEYIGESEGLLSATPRYELVQMAYDLWEEQTKPQA